MISTTRIAIISSMLFGITFQITTSVTSACFALNDVFKVGDLVEASVSGLEGDRYYEPCVVTEVLDTGYRLKCSGMEYVVQRAWVRQPKNSAPAQGLPAPQNEKEDAVEQLRNRPNGDCNYEVPAKVSSNDRFSVGVARRKLYDNYRLSVRAGGTSSPLDLGVSFLTVQLGRAYINIAQDGYRINDAAPVNAAIYTVKTKHVVCEKYSDRTLRRNVEGKYACFKDRFGEWVCGLDGVPKITQLQ